MDFVQQKTRLTMKQPYMLHIQYCQYHSCWCPGDISRQGISRHATDQISRKIQSLAWEELKLAQVMACWTTADSITKLRLAFTLWGWDRMATTSLQNKIWNLPNRSTILPKFIYDKEGKFAEPTQIFWSGSAVQQLFWVHHFADYILKLDESTARRQLKSPQSLSGRSIHLTLVTKWSWSWSWMTHCHLLCAMSIGPPILRYSYFKIWPWNLTFWLRYRKFHIWPWKFKVKVMVKVKPDGHIWALEFNQYVSFLFRGNRATFGWDMGNSIFDLENSRSRSWPRSNPVVTFEP